MFYSLLITFKSHDFRDHQVAQVAQVVQVTVKTEMEMKVSMFSKADKAFEYNYYCTAVAKLYKCLINICYFRKTKDEGCYR